MFVISAGKEYKMSKEHKKRVGIVLFVFFSLFAIRFAISIAIAYIPALSHLEMIFTILPQTILYLFFGFTITYTQSHYNNKEASNGAKYVNIKNPFLKRMPATKPIIPNENICQGVHGPCPKKKFETNPVTLPTKNPVSPPKHTPAIITSATTGLN